MNKREILRGMKLSRKVHDKLLEEKFALKGEPNSDTAVTSSGLPIHIGSEPPSDSNAIWFDTSDYN